MTGHELLGGRYELRGLLGRGGMAEVRDAFDTLLRRPVAVKTLHPNLDSLEYRRRFEQEARAAAVLEHPNIVAVHDFGEHDGSPFIVMERLPGNTLADAMACGPMPPPQVRSMLDDVLAALGAAHRAGVLHRDIKPGNILVSSTGDGLKVGDFGIAKTADAMADTKTGQIIGTMCYMSPERVAGAPASVADDLYAVGVIAYEALLGRRAFPQDNPVAVAHAIVNAPPPPLSTFRLDVDPALAGVIDRSMARDPAHRFRSADDMRAAL
ncbi:serine/threonine-protein kinase, partial [Mycolicibacterium vaccae]|uniref:serine/threonine-protein kinase n=1 Tax=Mycolicibacterium vaccae TaxID=1810 RepID=UPI003CFB502E